MDYTQLVSDKRVDGSIKQWANNDLVPATTILAEAQQLIYRGGPGRAAPLRVSAMLTTATGVMSTSAAEIALPSSQYLKGRLLQITGTNQHKLTQKTPEFVEGCITYDADGNRETGLPDYWFDADKIYFNVVPDQAYPYRFLHYQQLAPLSEAAPTNFLTERASYALRCACMAQVFTAYPRDDKERLFYLGQLDAAILKLNQEDQMNQSHVDAVTRVG